MAGGSSIRSARGLYPFSASPSGDAWWCTALSGMAQVGSGTVESRRRQAMWVGGAHGTLYWSSSGPSGPDIGPGSSYLLLRGMRWRATDDSLEPIPREPNKRHVDTRPSPIPERRVSISGGGGGISGSPWMDVGQIHRVGAPSRGQHKGAWPLGPPCRTRCPGLLALDPPAQPAARRGRRCSATPDRRALAERGGSGLSTISLVLP